MQMEHSCRKAFLFELRSSKVFAYIVINLAFFSDAYIYALIIPVLPFALVERINLRDDKVQQWIGLLLAAYAAGLIVGAPITGSFADRTSSRRGPYLLGLVALAFSTITLHLGRSTFVLLMGRLIQGVSSGAVYTVGMAILSDKIGQAGMGPIMGFVGMSVALGIVLGPMLGGILYHQLGYHAVFGSAYILIGLDLLFRVCMIIREDGGFDKSLIKSDGRNYGTIARNEGNPETPTMQESEDITNEPYSSLSACGHFNPSSTESVDSFNSLFVTKALDPIQQPSNTQRHAMLVLLKTPRMLTALLGDFSQSLVMTGLEAILPLRMKTLFHYNSMQVALVFLTLSFGAFVGPVTGYLSDRIGAKITVCLGFLSTAPLLILLRLVDHNSTAEVALLCCLLVLLGISLNMVYTPSWSEASYVVDEKMNNEPGIFGTNGAYGQAFSLMNVSYATGSLVGPLMGGFLVESVGWNDLTLGTGILCSLCVVPCLYATGGRRHHENKPGTGKKVPELR